MGVWGLAPASSEASGSKGWFGGSKVRRAGRGKSWCPHTHLGGGGGANARLGLGVGVKSGLLIRGGYWNRPSFRLANRLAESLAGRSAGRKHSRTFWAENCALPG